jgi:hypothetical protein
VLRRLVQHPEVLFRAGPHIAFGATAVVGQPEPRRREQLLAVNVVGESARFTQQLIDGVAVIHAVLVAADQPRQGVHALVREPHFDAVGIQPRFDLVANQAAMHHVAIAVDVDHAAPVDATPPLQTTVQPLRRQRPQRGQLLGVTRTTSRVALAHDLLHERRIIVPAGEVAAAAQEQRLSDGGLEVPMR